MDFNYLDIGIIVIILLTALIGMVQGFVWMAIFLTTWVTAIFLCYTYIEALAKALPFVLGVEFVQQLIAGLLIFLGVLLAGAFISFLFRKAIEAIGIRVIDRILGAALGVALGVLILSLLTILAEIFSTPDLEVRQASMLTPKLEEVATWIRSMGLEELLDLPAKEKIETKSPVT
jgi:membrane protein required for colicin V production